MIVVNRKIFNYMVTLKRIYKTHIEDLFRLVSTDLMWYHQYLDREITCTSQCPCCELADYDVYVPYPALCGIIPFEDRIGLIFGDIQHRDEGEQHPTGIQCVKKGRDFTIDGLWVERPFMNYGIDTQMKENEVQSMGYFDMLPTEILEKIFAYVHPRDLKRLSCSCDMMRYSVSSYQHHIYKLIENTPKYIFRDGDVAVNEDRGTKHLGRNTVDLQDIWFDTLLINSKCYVLKNFYGPFTTKRSARLYERQNAVVEEKQSEHRFKVTATNLLLDDIYNCCVCDDFSIFSSTTKFPLKDDDQFV